MDTNKRQQGFTLIELAIVLVIIGLLLTAALKGAAMIESSKMKQVKRFHDQFKAAYHLYWDRYRVLPGDDPDADARFPDVDLSGYEGNGDQQIDGDWRASEGGSSNETIFLWAHLTASGLLGAYAPATNSWAGSAAGNTDIYLPLNHFDGVVGFEFNTGLQLPLLCFNGLEEDVALQIDIAYDDGIADEGGVFATDSGADTVVASYSSANTLCFAL